SDLPAEQLIFVPQNAELYAAFGAALYGMAEETHGGRSKGIDSLRDVIHHGRRGRRGDQATPPLCREAGEVETFRGVYAIPKYEEPQLDGGEVVRGVIGCDGGSTSSKAVFINEDGEIMCKAYQLSKGNPIQDTKDLLLQIRDNVEARGARM